MPAQKRRTQAKAVRSPKRATRAEPRAAHENGDEYGPKDYKTEPAVRLSAGLAETVAGMLLSAMSTDPKHRAEMHGSPRNTLEYQRFAGKKHPPEVRKWVRDNFMVGGDGFAAVESEMEIYVDELAVWMENALRYHTGHWCVPFCNCTVPPGCP